MAWVLVLVGALSWGLVGGLGFNLVNSLLGNMPTAEKAVYILIGLAAVMMLLAGKCKKCGHESCGGGEGHSCGEGSGCSCGNGEKKM